MKERLITPTYPNAYYIFVPDIEFHHVGYQNCLDSIWTFKNNKPTKHHVYNEDVAKAILTYVHKEKPIQTRFHFDARLLISTLYNMFKRLR